MFTVNIQFINKWPDLTCSFPQTVLVMLILLEYNIKNHGMNLTEWCDIFRLLVIDILIVTASISKLVWIPGCLILIHQKIHHITLLQVKTHYTGINVQKLFLKNEPSASTMYNNCFKDKMRCSSSMANDCFSLTWRYSLVLNACPWASKYLDFLILEIDKLLLKNFKLKYSDIKLLKLLHTCLLSTVDV